MKKIINSEKTIKILALCGIILFILEIVLYYIILSAIRPGYDSLNQYISELGETGAPNATIATVFFFVGGVLIILFSIGLYKGIQEANYSWIGPLILVLWGLFDSIGSSIFPCDPGCVGVTFTGKMHLVVSGIGMLLITTAPFFVWRSLKGEEKWHGYDTFTLIVWIIALLMFGVFMYSYATGLLIGLIQRIAYLIYLSWILILSIKLLKLYK